MVRIAPGGKMYNFVLFDRLIIAGDLDLQGGVAGEDFGEKAFPVGRQMSDNNESHPRSWRNGLKEIFQRAKSAGRLANADNRERSGIVFGVDRQFRGPFSPKAHEAYSKLIMPGGFATSPMLFNARSRADHADNRRISSHVRRKHNFKRDGQTVSIIGTLQRLG